MTGDKPELRWGLKAVYVAALGYAALGAWILRQDPVDIVRWGGIGTAVGTFVREHSWLVVATPALAAVAKMASDYLTRSWLLRIVQSLLTDYCDEIFSNQTGPRDHHRATLFEKRTWAFRGTWPWTSGRLPWSGWLVPVVRSGHTTQKVRTRFLAPDRATRSEGVAGITWRRLRVHTTPRLPNLTSASPAADIDEYCRVTKVSRRWVEQRLADGEALPCSLRGLPVEVSNQPWGVIVLDSLDPDAFVDDPTGSGRETRVFLAAIGRLLARATI